MMVRNTASALALVFLVGCTTPNPESCIDGLCTDQRFPFCDVDGAIDGHPNTCIAVSCAPLEFEACRGDEAITCNQAGNDYDLIQCPLGCNAAGGGCVACADDNQCSNPSPVCDPSTKACRTCQSNNECASNVCDLDTGACVPETAIVYAAPTGPSTGECTQSQPCSLARAVMVATTAAVTPTLRMKPGSYTAPLVVSAATSKPLVIVADGATIASTTTTITVTNGASVQVRGVATLAPERQIVCGGVTGPLSTLSVVDATFVKSSLQFAALELERCTLTLNRSKLLMNNTETVVQAASDTVFHADRIDVVGTNNHYIFASGERVEMRVTNSLLENMGFSLYTSDTANPGSSFLFGFDTFAGVVGELDCTPVNRRTILIENSIITGLPGPDTVSGAGCTFSKAMVFPQTSALVGGVVADPQFVAPAQRDYRLLSTSPAIDSASASQTTLGPDLDGTPRPQGSAADLGAYEYKP